MGQDCVFYCNIEDAKQFSLPVNVKFDSIKVLINLKGETLGK